MKTIEKKKRILIIGAVAAGTSAAAKARRNDEDADIVIYDMDRHISYSGCGLPYYIGNKVEDMLELTPRDAAFFKSKYEVDVLTRHQVEAVDTVAKKLSVRRLDDDTSFDDYYDTLVLATGAKSLIVPIPGVGLPHVFSLRNPSDALAIRSYIEKNKPKKAAVVGTGFIGLEMVDNLTAIGLEVTAIEKLEQVCPFVDPDMAPYIENKLKACHVEVITGHAASAILPSSVQLSDNRQIKADLVILAIGVLPNVDLAKRAGIAIGPTGAIAVNEKMQTNCPDVYACGDCAEARLIVDGRPIYRPLGSTANKMGRIVGDVITGGALSFRGIAGTGIFGVFDLTIAACGLSEKEALESGYDIVVNHNIKPARPKYMGGNEMVIKAIADKKSGRLLGVQIIGYEGVDKRIDVFVTAMTAGMTVADLFHLDLAYAPPFSTTKDPVMYTGMILDNAIAGGRELVRAEEMLTCKPDQYQIIDARAASQFEKAHVDGAINVPHESFRAQIDSLDPSKPVVTYCNKGTTGNAIQNILINRGFKKVYNLSGGHQQYKVMKACQKNNINKKDPTP